MVRVGNNVEPMIGRIGALNQMINDPEVLSKCSCLVVIADDFVLVKARREKGGNVETPLRLARSVASQALRGLATNDQVNPVADSSATTPEALDRNSGSTFGSPRFAAFKAVVPAYQMLREPPEMFVQDGGYKKSNLVMATFDDGHREEVFYAQNWDEAEPWWYVQLGPDEETGLPVNLATFGVVDWEYLSEGIFVS